MSEIGRELRASELQVNTVVVIQPPQPPGLDIYFTMWVKDISPAMVAFWSGEKQQMVVNFIKSDGTIVDNRGHTVRVFEFKGDV